MYTLTGNDSGGDSAVDLIEGARDALEAAVASATAFLDLVQGSEGFVGPEGPAGPAGSDGSSAYEVAVANGFVGDETAWLASLVGAEGPAGAEGPEGPAGAAGEAGATGPQGEQGLPGNDGAAGADGAATHVGEGAPSDDLGANGDFYIDELADALYVKEGGAWGDPKISVELEVVTPATTSDVWAQNPDLLITPEVYFNALAAVTLTGSSGVYTPDLDNGINFKLTLSENTTIGLPTIASKHQGKRKGVIEITIGSSAYTVNPGTGIIGTIPTLPTEEGSILEVPYSVTSSGEFMLGASGEPAAAPAIEFIGDAHSTTSGTPSQPGSYLIGDMLIACITRDLTSGITVPSGWTVIDQPTPAQSCSGVTAYRVATTDGADDLGTWTGAQRMSMAAYRNVSGIGAHNAAYFGTSGNISFAGLTLEGPNSWTIGYSMSRVSGTTGDAKTGMTTRHSTSAGLGVRYFDSNGIVATCPAEVVDKAGTSTSNGFYAEIELKGF
jgi:hypothetical protein